MKNIFKKFKNIILLISLLAVSIGFSYMYIYTPNDFIISEGESCSFNIFPFFVESEKERLCYSNCINPCNIEKSYCAKLKFLNFFPIKTVSVNVAPKEEVEICGTPFGIKIYTEGVMIIGISEVYSKNGFVSPAKNCGLKKGDVLKKVNNKEIYTNEELEKIIENSEGNEISLIVQRCGDIFETLLKPVKSYDEGKYRAGIWVRDSSAGIGTLTFRNPKTKFFAGLGHGICDVDTGNIIPLFRGEIVNASIFEIKKGSAGVPGELHGNFVDLKSKGEIFSNTESGIYGRYFEESKNENLFSVAMKQNVKTGPAKLFTTVDGNVPKYYDINIDSINYNVNLPTKNIKISVKDAELLKKTGGIVQGMSGSPIIQNDMLVGAITHVFINNPAKGYGIFAETMLTNSNKIFRSITKVDY